MRLHTSKFRADTVERIVKSVGGNVGIGELREHRSSIRDRGIELKLSGSSIEGGAYGTCDYRTATWDEYGIVLARLFELDPDMVVGGPKNPTYEDGDDFTWQTCGSYAHLRIEDACKRHKWDHEYERGLGWVGSACVRCGRERRPSQRRIAAIEAGTWNGRG